MEWQKIETAPKDGTHIKLGCKKKNGEIGASHAQYSWSERNRWFSHYEEKGFGVYPTPFKPTHWMPMISPPLQTHPENDR